MFFNLTTNDLPSILAIRDESAFLRAYSLVSHVTLVVALVVAWRSPARRWMLAAFLAAALSVSLGYHTCATYDSCMGLHVETWRAMDHITANLLIVAFPSLLMAHRDQMHRAAYYQAQMYFAYVATPLACLAVAFAQMIHPFTLYVTYVALGASKVTLTVWYLFFRRWPEKTANEPGYVFYPLMVNPGYLVPAILFAGAGIGMFIFPLGEATSSWPHSTWHLFIGLSYSLFILAFDRVGHLVGERVKVQGYYLDAAPLSGRGTR